jgi:hypothetical protein
LGKNNTFYYNNKVEKGGDSKVETNSWFVCDVNLAYGIENIGVIQCTKAHMKQELGILFK